MKSKKSFAVSGGLKLKKPQEKKISKKPKAAPAPKPLVLPPRPPRKPNSSFNFEEPIPIDDNTLNAIALSLARADTWRERQQHLNPLKNFYLTYAQLSLIVHRLLSFDERMKAMTTLKDNIRDSEHSFYLFSQSFALLEERKQVSQLFNIPLIE